MRIAVIGAGGTGGYFGGLLAQAGEEVSFIARGATRDALAARGLTLKSRQHGPVTIPVRVADDPAAVGPVDLILFCVKTYNAPAAAVLLPPLVGPDTLLLSPQNGIGNEEALARYVSPGNVLGCVAAISAVVEEAGVIRLDIEPGALRFGELAGGPGDRLAPLLATLRRARFESSLHEDMPVQLWSKLLFIAAFSGMCALTRLPMGTIRQYPASWEFTLGVMREVLAVGRAHDVPLTDAHLEGAIAMNSRMNASAYGSMYHDLAAGRPLELDALNGAVARLGRAVDIPTPHNDAIYAALEPYRDGGERRSAVGSSGAVPI